MEKLKEQTVAISRRLRPIRLGFLVPPQNAQILRRVIQANTCLWGGRFNPIIPFFKKTHPSFVEGRYKPSAKSIVDGYIAGFSPDYLVVNNKTTDQGFTFPKERIIDLEEVLRPKDEQSLGFGLDVSYVYADLYEKEFKFQRRHPIEVISPRMADKSLSLFYSTFFGEFPLDKELSYLEKSYKEALGAKDHEIKSENFYTTLFQRPFHPLRAGSVSLQVRNPGWERAQIFFMDATSPLDLMDYWNLRVVGRAVIPMPIQLAEHAVGPLSNFVSQNHVPDRLHKEWMHHTTIICSRSCKLQELEAFIKKLQIPTNSLVIQRWYPRIWDEWARQETDEGTGVLTAEEDSITVTSSNGRINFQNLTPKFIEHVSTHRTPHWINVIHLSYQDKLHSAPVIPPGIPDLDRILCEGSLNPTWASEEGIVVPCVYWRDSHFWELPTPLRLFKAYMEKYGYELDISSAGKIALQVLRALGGVWGISSLGNEEVLKQLEAMAHGVAESSTNNVTRQRTRAATVSFDTWWGLLQRANEGNAEIAKNHLRNLLSSGIFRLGLRLQCSHCSQYTWFGLEQMAKDIICERCLQKFSFPMQPPPSQESWHYRTVGPFSIEGYAQGSYCTLLTSAFLFGGHRLHGDVSWIPSITLKDTKKQEVEVDFAAFWRLSRFGQRTSPVLVLGECKTFDKFTSHDVSRMANLAETFPGAIIVFSTIRKSLDDKEKKLIASLARKGRKHLKAERWRNPVMVLTGVELLNRMGPPSCWEDAGMPYSQFVDQYHHHKNPEGLCDMLQQMHLGIESHHAWYEQQWQRKQARKKKA